MKRGYYWVKESEYPFGPLGSLTAKNSYYYLGVTSYENIPCAKIAVCNKTMVFHTNPGSIAKALPMLRKLGFSETQGSGEELPLQIKFDKGTFQGEIFVDLKTGEVLFQKFFGQLILMIVLFGGDPSESTVDFTMQTKKITPSGQDEEVKRPTKKTGEVKPKKDGQTPVKPETNPQTKPKRDVFDDDDEAKPQPKKTEEIKTQPKNDDKNQPTKPKRDVFDDDEE